MISNHEESLSHHLNESDLRSNDQIFCDHYLASLQQRSTTLSLELGLKLCKSVGLGLKKTLLTAIYRHHRDDIWQCEEEFYAFIAENHDLSDWILSTLWNEQLSPSFRYQIYIDALRLNISLPEPPSPLSFAPDEWAELCKHYDYKEYSYFFNIANNENAKHVVNNKEVVKNAYCEFIQKNRYSGTIQLTKSLRQRGCPIEACQLLEQLDEISVQKDFFIKGWEGEAKDPIYLLEALGYLVHLANTEKKSCLSSVGKIIFDTFFEHVDPLKLSIDDNTLLIEYCTDFYGLLENKDKENVLSLLLKTYALEGDVEYVKTFIQDPFFVSELLRFHLNQLPPHQRNEYMAAILFEVNKKNVPYSFGIVKGAEIADAFLTTLANNELEEILTYLLHAIEGLAGENIDDAATVRNQVFNSILRINWSSEQLNLLKNNEALSILFLGEFCWIRSGVHEGNSDFDSDYLSTDLVEELMLCEWNIQPLMRKLQMLSIADEKTLSTISANGISEESYKKITDDNFRWLLNRYFPTQTYTHVLSLINTGVVPESFFKQLLNPECDTTPLPSDFSIF